MNKLVKQKYEIWKRVTNATRKTIYRQHQHEYSNQEKSEHIFFKGHEGNCVITWKDQYK